MYAGAYLPRAMHFRRIWVVAADRAQARVYRHQLPGEPLEAVETHANERAAQKASALTQDHPGHGDAHNPRTVSRREEPSEIEAERFATDLAARLRKARANGEYDELVLVAEPAFLGALRARLDRATERSVRGQVDKDLTHAPEAELRRRLRVVLRD